NEDMELGEAARLVLREAAVGSPASLSGGPSQQLYTTTKMASLTRSRLFTALIRPSVLAARIPRVTPVGCLYSMKARNDRLSRSNLLTAVQHQTSGSVRSYSAKEPLTLDMIQQRVLLVLRLYDKVNSDKVLKSQTVMQRNSYDRLTSSDTWQTRRIFMTKIP
ncbi:Acyl carrier protein-like, partial [Homarus americanus]